MNRRDFLSGLGVFVGTLAAGGVMSIPKAVGASEAVNAAVPEIVSGLAELDALTRNVYIPALVENFFRSCPVLHMLEKKSVEIDGGQTVIHPVPHRTVCEDGCPDDSLLGASFGWGQYYVSLVLDERRIPKEQLSLLAPRFQAASVELNDVVGRHMYEGDPSGNGIVSLKDAVDSGIECDTYGGINRSKHRNLNGNTRVTGPHRKQLSLDDMKWCMEAATNDEERPNIILAGEGAWQQYYKLLSPPHRCSDVGFANDGYQSLMYHGIPIVCDQRCQPNRMYFLNTKFWDLYKLKDMWFSFAGWKRVPNSEKLVGVILVHMILACSSPRMNSKLILGEI